MIDERKLKQIHKLRIESQNLKDRIEKMNRITQDSVKGSSKSFPYIQHTCVIEGIDDSSQKRKYKRLIKDKERKISKIIINLEYELNKIEDSEINSILRYKYEDDLTYYQVAMKMNEDFKTDKYTEDNIRMKINRFFAKK